MRNYNVSLSYLNTQKLEYLFINFKYCYNIDLYLYLNYLIAATNVSFGINIKFI